MACPIDCPVQSAPTELTIEPAARTWASLVRHDTGERATRFRRQLGLPTNAPVIMSGHQAEVWHPGILSKYLAAISGAEAIGAHPAWLVVDQDTGDPLRVRFAEIDGEGRARAGESDLGVGARAGDDAGVPTGLAPSGRIAGSCPGPVRPIADALRAHESAASLSDQVQSGLEDLLAPITPTAQRVSALRLNQTDLFGELVGRMRRDPEACREAYNRAASGVPGAGVRALRGGESGSGPELPLWDIRTGERRRVYAADLDRLEMGHLAARGLLMTGLVRLAGCDLFVHGTGGGVYDRVTDRWFESWLGEAPRAKSVVVSATLRLGTGGGDGESLVAAERADALAWRAHAARHNPALLGDEESAARKRALVERIRDADPEDRGALFREMHALLEGVRDSHGGALAHLDAEAREAGEAAADARLVAQIARDRTLPFPLYPAERLVALRGSIRDAFGLGR